MLSDFNANQTHYYEVAASRGIAGSVLSGNRGSAFLQPSLL